MLRSMTGFGRAQSVLHGRELLVEIRAVNHRYFEFSSRIPRAYGYLEEKLKALLQSRISRGKVEVSVTINCVSRKDVQVSINQGVAEGYLNALREANAALGLRDDLVLSTLLRFPDVFTVQKLEDDETEVWTDVSQVAEAALDRFVSMREAEGKRLHADIGGKLTTVESFVYEIEQIAPNLAERYRERLYGKLTELLQDRNVDEQRILTEAAVFSEKVAVDEETVRLHSHIAQFHALLEAQEAVGRKLDFLVQEMNREVNTIGSKAQDLRITQIVVNLKSEIEKIREQIQNIE